MFIKMEYASDKPEEVKDDKVDYLDVDDTIAGQNYVCLSFVSPDALIQKREGFNVSKFLQSYCKEQKLEFKDVYSKYEDFTYKFSKELQRDFDEQNNFQTSIRGVKIRGVYDSKDAAMTRAKKLSTIDSSFHVFIGQVGYWLPWDPCADSVEDEVFQNSQLNDMMEKYQENNVNKDIFYEEQKRDKVQAAREEVLKKKKEDEEKAKLEAAAIEDKAEEPVEGDAEGDAERDAEEPVAEEPVAEEPVPEETKEVVEEMVHKVDKDIKDSLEGVDPWLANKLQQKEDATSTDPEPEPEPESEPELEPEPSCPDNN
ncbi:hypothetical protein [uncultured Mediterranean phage]|nr:hypothetical protein [uncultured Mediterranean phage]